MLACWSAIEPASFSQPYFREVVATGNSAQGLAVVLVAMGHDAKTTVVHEPHGTAPNWRCRNSACSVVG